MTGRVWPDCLSNKQRINEISILSFLQFYCKINRNQLEIVVKATYGLHSNKYFEILNLTFWGRSLVARHFGLHSNYRGADEIKDFPILIDFEFLLLFSIISPCMDQGGNHMKKNFEYFQIQKWVLQILRVKKLDKKWSHFVFPCSLSELWFLNCLKKRIFAILHWIQQKI